MDAVLGANNIRPPIPIHIFSTPKTQMDIYLLKRLVIEANVLMRQKEWAMIRTSPKFVRLSNVTSAKAAEHCC